MKPKLARGRHHGVQQTIRQTFALALVATAATLAVPASSSADSYWGPGYRGCGRHTLHSREGGPVKLYVAARHTSCRKALKIQREFWGAPERRLVTVNGG